MQDFGIISSFVRGMLGPPKSHKKEKKAYSYLTVNLKLL